MAKSKKDSGARRKKVTRSVADGIAHVHASFNNTIITITDRQGNAHCPGRPLVVLVSVVPVKAPRLLPRWLPKTRVTLPRTTV